MPELHDKIGNYCRYCFVASYQLEDELNTHPVEIVNSTEKTVHLQGACTYAARCRENTEGVGIEQGLMARDQMKMWYEDHEIINRTGQTEGMRR